MDKPQKQTHANVGQVKGHQAVVGTCDVRNDRQATAELVDLLNDFADKVYPETDEKESSPSSAVPDSGSNDNSKDAPAAKSPAEPAAVDSEKVSPGEASARVEEAGGSSEKQEPQELSVEEMIRKEADALRAGQNKTRRFQSVNTFVKGVVMVCVLDPQVDVLRLVDAMFEEIRQTRKRRGRFLERVTPMQAVAFSELEAFKTAAEPVVASALPPVAEGVPPLVLPARAAAAAKTTAAAPAATDESAVDAASTTAGSVDKKQGDASSSVESSKKVEEISTEEAGTPSGGKQLSEASVVEAAAVSPLPTAALEVKGDGAAEASAAAEREGTVVDAKKEADKGGGGDGGGGGGTVNGGGEGAAAAAVAGSKTSDKRYKFRVDVRRRNSGLKRIELINAVADSVGAGHSVNMAAPDVRCF